MKLRIKTDALKKTVLKAAEAIPAKASDPAFMNFLLTVEPDSVQLLASDGSITIKTTINQKDEKGEDVIISAEPGKIQVNAKLFTEMVSKIEGSEVTLDLVDAYNLSVSDGTTNFHFNTADAEEYPDIDMSFDVNDSIRLSGKDFLDLYQATAFAVSIKGSKQCFTGINVRAGNDKVVFLATDACRLAQKTVAVPGVPECTFTAPVKVLSMIAKTEGLAQVDFQVGSGKALFLVGNSIYQTRLYSGDFPSADRIRPTHIPYTLKVDADEFVRALDRVTLVTLGEATPIARLTCSPEKVELKAISQANGAGKECLRDATFNGTLFEIGFNVRFVTEAVRALGTKEVTLAFAGEGKLFMVQNGDDSNLQIITPIRDN